MIVLFGALLIAGVAVSAGIFFGLVPMRPINKLNKQSERSRQDDVALARRTIEILRHDNSRNHEQK